MKLQSSGSQVSLRAPWEDKKTVSPRTCRTGRSRCAQVQPGLLASSERRTAWWRPGVTDATAQWSPASVVLSPEVSMAAETWLSLDSNTLCLFSQSDPLFSGLILALLPSAGGKVSQNWGGGCCQPAPTTQSKGGGERAAYYTSLLPLLSLQIHVALPLCPSHHF